MLFARISEAFPLFCPRCGEPMRIIPFVTEVQSTQRILEHLSEPSNPRRLPMPESFHPSGRTGTAALAPGHRMPAPESPPTHRGRRFRLGADPFH
ncbi:MAG: hypothetical protein ACREX8_07375, partial [Gammaproteobacteria bacterium]